MSKVAEGLSFETYESGFDRETSEFEPIIGYNPKPNQKEKNREYWFLALEMLGKFGNFIGRRKLLVNVLDPSTYPKVKRVLEKDFRGDVSRLRDRTKQLEREFFESIDELNRAGKEHGFNQIGYNAMTEAISERTTREKFRRAVKKHLKREDEPIYFLELPERDFRKTKST